MGPGRDAFSAPQYFTRGHLSWPLLVEYCPTDNQKLSREYLPPSPPLSLSPRFIYFLKNANFRAKTLRSSSSGHRRPQRLLFRGLTEEESRTVQVTYRRGSWDSRVLQSKRSVSLNILIISQNF